MSASGSSRGASSTRAAGALRNGLACDRKPFTLNTATAATNKPISKPTAVKNGFKSPTPFDEIVWFPAAKPVGPLNRITASAIMNSIKNNTK